MTDRDQVAREVLTELANWNMARVETLKDATRFRDERYPAPAAPVTVTVEGVTWTKQGDPDGSVWIASVGGPPSRSDAEEFLDRIASDARRIEALERENTRLREEADFGDGGVGYLNAVNHGTNEAVRVLNELLDNGRPAGTWFGGEKLEALAQRLETLKRERDEARRLYAESEATSQGERLGAPASTSDEAPNSEVTGGGIAAASPAPIPLGAVVESVEYAYRFARYTHDWECMQGDPPVGHPVDVEVSALCTALYRALHPVADAATVERVAMAIWNVQTAEHNAWDAITERTRNTLRAEARATLRALGYTIQEGA